MSAAPGMQAYFRDPRSPRQRGTDENTNGLPRQYSPKGTDPSGYTEEHPDAAAMEPDDRPRKTPDHMKPSEKPPEPIDDTATPTDTTNTNCQQRCCNDH
ncbi:IS30 family transposase [Bifidobacterium boum]|nr:IS30 family transposase [Bifidobacterium boum]